MIYEHQYGFRKKHSTIHPILHLLNYIADSSDKPSKDITLGLFLDLSKAFDTISHPILLHKLNYYGIRGVCNDWFRSYLTNRKQYTETYSKSSSYASMTCGVPQGSILGPILFLIYINDIQNCTSLNLLSFADDTTVYSSHSNITQLFNNMNKELNELTDWFYANKLSLNVNKTKYTIFTPNRNISDLHNETIKLNDTPISRENSIKFLGVYIDEHITWKTHINQLKTKLTSALFAINRTKHILPHEALKTLYFVLIQSHLTYGIHAWGNTIFINQILKLQKRAVRLINKKEYRAHTDPLFKSENILKIDDLHKLHVSLFTHDQIYKRLPDSFSNFYKFTNMHTRQIHTIYKERPRTKFTSKLPKHCFPDIWNSLDKKLRETQTRNKFKNKIKYNILSNYNENVTCKFSRCPDCSENSRR